MQTKIYTFALKPTISILLFSALIFGGFFIAKNAFAHQDPATCSANGVGISLSVYRNDEITVIAGGDTVTPGETIKYRTTLSALGLPNCNFSGGTLSITTPDGTTDVTPGGPGIPLVSVGSPFVSSFVSYTVDSAEVGGDNDVDASTNYTGGSSHNTNGQHDSASGSVNKQTPFVKLNSTTTTQVHNPSHTDITGQTVAFGTDVHDEATVTGTQQGGTPTGTVDFTLFSGLTCNGQTLNTWPNVALTGGVAESPVVVDPAAGTYSYLVHYDGDANYNESIAQCEPFTIVLPLEVQKTANTSYDRDWNWTIDKSADQTSLLLAEGESFTVNYDVTVNASSTIVNRMVTGSITITNPAGNPNATIQSVSDVLNASGAATTVNCNVTFPHILAGGQQLVCSYTKNNASANDNLNTATVTTSGDVPGGSGNAAVVWSQSPNNEIDECIDVSDTNDTDGVLPNTICANNGSLPHTYEYGLTFGPAGVQGVEVPVACGESDWPNTASFVTTDDNNDTTESGQDSWNVHVNVDCQEGCTLTQGYWKTHNDSFWGGAPTDDTWDEITPLAELSGFFTNDGMSYPVPGPNNPPFTWFSVFWTAPKGNPYYNLAHQYMAAKLNMLNDASSTPAVDAAIAYAEDLFDSFGPSTSWSKAQKNAMTTNAGTLASYNEGLIGPGHCDEQNPD